MRREAIGAWARAHGHPERWLGPVPDEGEIDDKPKASIGDDELDVGDDGNADIVRFEPGRVDVDPDAIAVEDG